MRYFRLALVILVFIPALQSCGHHTRPGPAKDSTNAVQDTSSYGRYNRDSDYAYSDNRERYKQFNAADYPVFARRTIGHYVVTVLHYKQGPEINPDGSIPPARAVDALCIILFKNQETGKSDTVVMAVSDIENADDLKVKDLTKDFGFDKLVFCIEYQGEDDNMFDKIYGYKGDTLTELFEIGSLLDLKRKNRNTLYGHCVERDDLLALGRDYNVTVSLPNYDVDISPPDTMVFNYETHAKDTIQTWRISRPGALRGTPYTILPGTILTIDTFFNRTKIITLHMGDSIFIRATFDQLESKVQGDDAG